MKLLAIDTSTEACSAALFLDGSLFERYQLAPREHAALILEMCDHLLADAGLSVTQLDGVAFGRGPGSFTGVRIAAGVTQGIAFAADLPVVPVSTLRALAQGGFRELGTPAVLAAIDARMGEVYWGGFREQDGLMMPVVEEQVTAPEEVVVPEGAGWFGVGTGWGTYKERLQARLGDKLSGHEADRFPHAQDVAVLAASDFLKGEAKPAEQAIPVYLRDNVAKKSQRST